MMTLSNLPEDLVVEILSRVPAVSLARLRLTSKGWNALIKDDRVFAKEHSNNASRQSMALVLIDHRVYLVRFNPRDIHNNVALSVTVTRQISLKDPLSNNYSEDVDIRTVFHCHGLLLCTTNDYRLVVWNPCSGETRWIQQRNSYKKDDCYALGRSSCNKYKILRQDLIDSSQEQDIYEYELYDFTSNSWRGVGVTTDLFFPEINRRGISVNGITYWLNIFPQFLVSFDFSTERFDSVSLPEVDSPLAISVTGEGQQLCMLSDDSYVNETNINLWIATKSENTGAMSWSKFPIFQGFGLRYRCHFSEGVSFFAYPGKEKIFVYSCHRPNRHSKNIIYIAGHGKCIEFDHHGAKPTHELSPTPLLLLYVPSLVQIEHGTREYLHYQIFRKVAERHLLHDCD